MYTDTQMNAEFNVPLSAVEAELFHSLTKTEPGDLKATASTEGHRNLISSEVRKKLGAQLDNLSDATKSLVCSKLKYCERIDSEPVKLAIDIADLVTAGVIALHFLIPIPIIRISVYFVRTNFLDQFCGCGK